MYQSIKTGVNLRNMKKFTKISDVEDVKQSDLVYLEIPVGDECKVVCPTEIIQLKNTNLSMDLLTRREIDESLETIIT